MRLLTANDFIAECEQSPHILEGPTRQFRGYIRLARGHRDEALADLRSSLERARENPNDPQTLVPALIRFAWASLQVGRGAEARAAFAEALPHLEKHPYSRPWTLPEVALELGEASTVREILAELSPSPGYAAMLAVLDREFEKASELYAEAGILLFEAEARLRTAEQLLAAGLRAEGEIELEKLSRSFARPGRSSSSVGRGSRQDGRRDGWSTQRTQGRHGRLLRSRRLHLQGGVDGSRGRRGAPHARITSASAPSSSGTAARSRSSSAMP